jgi:hypothetical protein
MAKVLCINDYPAYAEMVGAMLEKKGGHLVQNETVPISFKAIEAFDPDVIVINLVRKLETISAGGMTDFYTDVEGAKAFRELTLASSREPLRWPIVVTSLAVLEQEVPKDECLKYVAFVEVPQKLDQLNAIIEKIAASRREQEGLLPE